MDSAILGLVVLGSIRKQTDRGIKDTTRKPTESCNLGSWGLTETERTTREPAWD